MVENYLINTEKLERELNRFTAFVQFQNYERTGIYSKYISFRDAGLFLEDEEGYKTDVAQKARIRLRSAEWDESWIATKDIHSCVLKAISCMQHNLVDHHQVTGFRNRFNPIHKDFTPNAEKVLFDIYCGDNDEAAFKQAIETFGAKYDLIAYLFFIKNPGKYLPVRSRNFDKGFQKLGIDYKTECSCSIEMRYEDENIWLTQKMMAALYNVGTNTINYHVKKIFEDSELQEGSVIRKFRITAEDGKTYNTNHYSLEMIIAVGFKVNSERAVQFRKWVNQIARDYTIKGWVLDDERLKNGGSVLTTEYFERLLEQIREICLSERRFYQKITDIYATALDYDRTAKTTRQFFAKVQNKMHYAVHGHTAVELIYERADAEKEHMGLTTWAAAPEGKIVKSDVSIAKNYLTEQEMRSLERIVSAYLDLAKDRAERHIPMTMEDWSKRLDLFLKVDDRELLQEAGKITAEIAKAKAETEFEKYRIVQDRLFMSDFDKYILELEENVKK